MRDREEIIRMLREECRKAIPGPTVSRDVEAIQYLAARLGGESVEEAKGLFCGVPVSPLFAVPLQGMDAVVLADLLTNLAGGEENRRQVTTALMMLQDVPREARSLSTLSDHLPPGLGRTMIQRWLAAFGELYVGRKEPVHA